MTAGRSIAAVAGAILLSFVAAITYGDGDAVVSLQIWLAGSVIAVALVLVFRLLAAAGVEPARLVPVRLRRSRLDDDPSNVRILDLRATETLLLTVTGRPRTHVNRLRPRLEALADHHLTPEDRAAALGDVAWMIDPNVNDRAPTLEEVDRFLDRVLGRAGSGRT